MPNDILYLGLELTFSHLVILLIDQEGNIVEQLQRSHGSQGIEQQPQDWWRAVRTGIKETLRRNNIEAGQIRSLGITAIANAPVLVDADGKVLCPSYVGNDGSLGDLEQGLVGKVGARNLQNIVNQVANGDSAVAKLLYLKEQYPRAWHDATTIMLPSSFLRFRLTGKSSIDAGSASETQLFNTKTGAWSKMLMTRLGLPAKCVPSIGPGDQICGRVSEEASKESGLAIGTPVVQAGHRPSCLSVALDALDENCAFLELNDYGHCYFPSDSFQKIADDSLACIRHGIKASWLYTARDAASIKSVNWLLEEIATAENQQAKRNKQNPLALLSETAAEIPPGSDGLVFVPPNSEGPGGFAGLTLKHKHGHMIRAVFESSAIQIRQAHQIFAQEHTPPERYIITGHAAENTLWCQIIADATETEVHCFPCEYPAALGAALLAGLCIGNFDDLDSAAKSVKRTVQILKPRKAASKVYQDMDAKLEELHKSIHKQDITLKAALS